MSPFTPSCIPRKAWLVALMAFSILVTLGLVILDHTSQRLLREEMTDETIAVMRTRLQFLESQYRGRQEDFIGVQARVGCGCNTPDPDPGDSEPSTHSPDLAVLLRNISGSKAANALLSSDKLEPINIPCARRIMPHLMDHPSSLRPAYQLGTPRQYADYIIGVTHVKRDKKMYLLETIEFLLNKMTEEDKNYTLITVMIGETNMTYVVETAQKIEAKFPEAVEAGLIIVISPSKHYYPDLDVLPTTLGDSSKRFKWRTKQNLDVIFLMAFAHTRCLYYLMVEDDVLAVDNYMTEIRKFTSETTVSNPEWFFIQYSTTGGIGKLFRSTDLIYILTYVQLFYTNMPIDWLMESYLTDRICGVGKTTKECIEAKKKLKPTYKKKLFNHVGLYSSLRGKLQKDSVISLTKSFDFFPHDNPPVTYIKCDLIHYEKYSIEAAYSGEMFFWGKQAKAGDVIEFWFQSPGKFDRYLIRSGNLKHANEIISKAVFEVLPATHKENGSFITIDKFDEFGMVEGLVDSEKYGELLAMRIRFEANSRYWVTITEIEFVYLETPASVVNQEERTNATAVS